MTTIEKCKMCGAIPIAKRCLHYFFVNCETESCETKGPSRDTFGKAIEAWNELMAAHSPPLRELSDQEIIDIWAPPLEPGTPTRPVLGKNKVLAFGRALLAAARKS